MVDSLDQLLGALRAAPPGEARGLLERIDAAFDDFVAMEDDGYRYELAATRVAVEVPAVVPVTLELLDTAEVPKRTHFLCFAVVATSYRRRFLHDRERDLVRRWARTLGDIPLFEHYRAMAYLTGNVDELEEGLDFARTAHAALPRHAGAGHTYALYIAALVSAGRPIDEELDFGLRLVRRSIERYERARFFHTRARLLRLLGRYGEAQAAVTRAIELEDRGTEDYHERIALYLLEQVMIENARYLDRIADEARSSVTQATEQLTRLQKQVDRFEAAQIRMVEVVAFVAAAIALVQATGGALQNRPTHEALILLGGLAVILFGAVGLTALVLRRTRPGRG